MTQFIARYILPQATAEHGIEALLGFSRPAARLDMLAVPNREHFDSFQDERPANPLRSRVLKVVKALFTCMYFFLMYLDTRISGNTYAEGVRDNLVIGKQYHSIVVMSSLVPLLLIWLVESFRHSVRSSLVSWYMHVYQFTSN